MMVSSIDWSRQITGTVILLLAPGGEAGGIEGAGGIGNEAAGINESETGDGIAAIHDTPDAVPGGAAFHHTTTEAVDSSASKGLYPGSYATPVEGLSPLQAHIELALNPAGGARNAVLKIDLAGLRSASYEIPQVKRVTGAYNMPGGRYEMRFPYEVPPEFVRVIQR